MYIIQLGIKGKFGIRDKLVDLLVNPINRCSNLKRKYELFSYGPKIGNVILCFLKLNTLQLEMVWLLLLIGGHLRG